MSSDSLGSKHMENRKPLQLEEEWGKKEGVNTLDPSPIESLPVWCLFRAAVFPVKDVVGILTFPWSMLPCSFADLCGARTEICVGNTAWALFRLGHVCSLRVAFGCGFFPRQEEAAQLWDDSLGCACYLEE